MVIHWYILAANWFYVYYNKQRFMTLPVPWNQLHPLDQCPDGTAWTQALWVYPNLFKWFLYSVKRWPLWIRPVVLDTDHTTLKKPLGKCFKNYRCLPSDCALYSLLIKDDLRKIKFGSLNSLNVCTTFNQVFITVLGAQECSINVKCKV